MDNTNRVKCIYSPHKLSWSFYHNWATTLGNPKNAECLQHSAKPIKHFGKVVAEYVALGEEYLGTKDSVKGNLSSVKSRALGKLSPRARSDTRQTYVKRK
jgi:hypothetical protein